MPSVSILAPSVTPLLRAAGRRQAVRKDVGLPDGRDHRPPVPAFCPKTVSVASIIPSVAWGTYSDIDGGGSEAQARIRRATEGNCGPS
jgi:hypothetical protein